MDGGCVFLEQEEDEFFDSREDISAASDSCPGTPGHQDLCLDENFGGWVWACGLSSVQERKYKFMQSMGLDVTGSYLPGFVDRDVLPTDDGGLASKFDGIMLEGGAALTVSVTVGENGSSSPGCSKESQCVPLDEFSRGNLEYSVADLDDGIISVVDELHNNGSLVRLDEARLNQTVEVDEFQRGFNPSSSFQHVSLREDSTLHNSGKTVRRWRGIGWLRRLGVAACIVNKHADESDLSILHSDWGMSSRVRRVKVRPYRKRVKELSAVYVEQDIPAHKGAILTMKFSLDGRYLASGGDDGVVCVWSVMEGTRSEEVDVPKDDPSCIYFMVNRNSKLALLYMNQEIKDKSSRTRRTPDSACVIVPPDIFRLSERPLHIFRGHDGDVLDLSWSNNKYLLSSSMDKTVRLWQVGCDSCLKVFSHNNFVTCIQFNPVNDKYFISGSIDGKVRIWEVPRCQVVDWIDVKEIVTAVCYSPDGKGGVIGFMSGDCHLFDATDNLLQLDVHISLQGKKKSPCKRITGFQYSPSDHRKLMVSSADSQIRIVEGTSVICKYKGLKNAGSQISASFTSDGSHIISAIEDQVYVWSHNNQDPPTSKQAKSSWSCERFISSNVSVAIPWHAFESKDPVPMTSEISQLQSNRKSCRDCMDNKLSRSFVLSPDFFSELLPKGSATWPEEKLTPSSMTISAFCKAHYKFLKISFQNAPHEWGRVIVTAGWDGRIRLFRNFGLPVYV